MGKTTPKMPAYTPGDLLVGTIVLCVEPGTEIRDAAGKISVVDNEHMVISRKGAIYVTPNVYQALKAATDPAQTAGDGK